MIGVFDSGVGGLTVLKALQAKMPSADFIYFGDTANVPYGEKTHEQILAYNHGVLSFLQSKDVNIGVMACNTSSALVYDELKNKFNFPIIDTIQTTAKIIANSGKRIGIIATKATVASGAFPRAIQAINPTAEIFQVACPALVPLIESGNINSEELDQHLKIYLDILLKNNIDTLVLGCTHYPILIDKIMRVIPENIRIVDPAFHIAQRLEAKQSSQGSCQFFVSGDPEQFAKTARIILGYAPRVDKIVAPLE